MLSELLIEQEHIPAFRAALGAAPDLLAAGAAEAGDIVFLATKVIEQGYLTFCDNFAARRWTYPAHARSKMRRRREALRPHLGLPILHGGVSHAGFMLNVFVDKASGAVIHWERDPREAPARATAEAAVPLTRVRLAAMVAAVATLVVCSTEMVPGRRLLRLGWDRSTFYLIAGVVGALSGAVLARHRLPGLIAGGPVMAGAVLCSALALEHLAQIPSLGLVMVAGVGALPGLALYHRCAWVSTRIFGKGQN